MAHRGIAGFLIPLVLIIVGVILLLNTLGVISWSAWGNIGRLWPVLIIAFGGYVLWRNARGG